MAGIASGNGPGSRCSGGQGIELVDALTRLTHLVTPDEMAAGHRRGDYQGFCGDRFQAACLVEPGVGQCQRCREQVTP